MRFLLLALPLSGNIGCQAFVPSQQKHHVPTQLYDMKRPILDQLATTLFRLENRRVEESSVVDEQGRMGEPMEWSESNSLANQFSEIVASNSLTANFKQWVADIVAGDYDEAAIQDKITEYIGENQVYMFSFTTCPFCRRAKDVLDELNVPYAVLELDEDDQGNAYRAALGKRTGRTSVPSIFIGGDYIGGCNDGNPGLLPLYESGELQARLSDLGVSYSAKP